MDAIADQLARDQTSQRETGDRITGWDVFEKEG
jgi:hypothetical protein